MDREYYAELAGMILLDLQPASLLGSAEQDRSNLAKDIKTKTKRMRENYQVLPRKDLEEKAFRKYEADIADAIESEVRINPQNMSPPMNVRTYIARFNDAKLGFRRYGYRSDRIPRGFDVAFIKAFAVIHDGIEKVLIVNTYNEIHKECYKVPVRQLERPPIEITPGMFTPEMIAEQNKKVEAMIAEEERKLEEKKAREEEARKKREEWNRKMEVEAEQVQVPPAIKSDESSSQKELDQKTPPEAVKPKKPIDIEAERELLRKAAGKAARIALGYQKPDPPEGGREDTTK